MKYVYQLKNKILLADGRKFHKGDILSQSALDEIMREYSQVQVTVLFIY